MTCATNECNCTPRCKPKATAPCTELLVFAAISLQEVLSQRIAPAYHEVAPNVSLRFNFNASGTLRQQIEQGAPADIFISASEGQMDILQEEGLIVDSTRFDLVGNTLVVVQQPGTTGFNSMEDLVNAESIAIGNPAFVPAGVYAVESMIYYGLYDELQPKLIFADNVQGVVDLVLSGTAQVGFVYNNNAVETPELEIAFIVPDESHAPIIYPAAVIKSSNRRLSAENFLDYLKTEEAQQYFRELGFKQIIFPKPCFDSFFICMSCKD